MDARRKFDGRAKDYAAGRPGYAPELIECLYTNYGICKSSVIADIGSGTGKFAKHLLDRGNEVFCVEPNEEMRYAAEDELREYTNFHSVAGDAEHTTLNRNSIDHIMTAQAFHWFDGEKFKQECRRIMKRDGKVFLIWNVRSDADRINQELYGIYSRYCPDFQGFSGGIKRDDQRIVNFFHNGYEYVSFDHPFVFNRKNFIARSLSSSYSLKESHHEYKGYIGALNALFDRYQKEGTVSISNQSVAYIGTV